MVPGKYRPEGRQILPSLFRIHLPDLMYSRAFGQAPTKWPGSEQKLHVRFAGAFMVPGMERLASSRDWAARIDSRRAIVEANVARAADMSSSSFLTTGFVSLP